MGVAVVTGASRGLGRCIASELADAGWDVIAVTRNPDANLSGVRTVVADITSDDAVESLNAVLGNRPLDLLVNNAAIGAPIVPLSDATTADLTAALDVNVTASFRLIRALLPCLLAAADPLVVNISSRLASLTAQARGDFAHLPSSYPYRISKAALNMLTVSVATELNGRIRCWAVHPGALLTEMALADAGKRPEEAAHELRELIETPSTESLRFLSLGTGDLPW
jgi:NAD(P)-dependent dehydrogenase (short-subunit alcohol dehydrogenase family)